MTTDTDSLDTAIAELDSFSAADGIQVTGAMDTDGWLVIKKTPDGTEDERLQLTIEDVSQLTAMLQRLAEARPR